MSTLERFREVIEGGADACLPRSLSDEWLQLMSQSVDDLLAPLGEADPQADPEGRAVALAALLEILKAKNPTRSEFEVSWDDLARYLGEYRIELGLEEVHRYTDLKYEPASVATIFTRRAVRTWREQ